MRNLTSEELNAEYLIYKVLTPNRHYKTYLAMKEDSHGTPYFVILKEMDQQRASIYHELSGMWNPYIANVYEVLSITNPDSGQPAYYVAITEYIYAKAYSQEECLSLTQFIQKNHTLSKSAALSICIQLCEGLKEFHKKGFVHRDLKPDNIMISQYDILHPQIKIIDFGGAKEVNLTKPMDTTVIGTLGYQPPESISSFTTQQADIYSIGCILNFMLTGQEPGVKMYKNDHYIVSIIEKATYEYAPHRYPNVTIMQKSLEHEMQVKQLDKIPLLRSLPGFRTHTFWKEIIAILSYISMIFLAEICLKSFGFWGFAEIFCFYIIIPLIVIFNMGNLLRFFPKTLRRNYHLFFMIRITIFLACMFLPILYDNYVAGRFDV